MKFFVALGLFVAVMAVCATGYAQQVATSGKSSAPSETGARPAPIDRNGALTLVRAVIIALQQANDTNNYGVLYAMSAPGFQSQTPAAKLAENFASMRAAKFDLSSVGVLEPQWNIPPQVDAGGVMRMAGYFPSAPMQVNFDLQFTPIDNRWKLLGLAVTVSPAGPIAPTAAAATLTNQRRRPQLKATRRGKNAEKGGSVLRWRS